MPNFSFLKSYEELQSELQRFGFEIPLSDDFSVLAEPLSFCSQNKTWTLPNRFVVQPMEGFDSGQNGEPTELSFRRYERFAGGGAGLIWFEATAVQADARSNSQQFWLNEKSADRFAALEEKTRSVARKRFGYDIVSVLQLTHSGRYSKPVRGVRAPVIAQHSGVLDVAHQIPADYPLIKDEELDRLQDAYVHAAKWAAKCGFDGVDIKSCHGYLLNELLGAWTREGKYGGSFENRTRFLRETITRVRNEVPSVFVTSRLNVYDAVKYPWGFGVDRNDYKKWDLTESKQLVAILREIGVPLLDITIGNPYFNPHFNRPYAKPIRGAVAYDEHPLIGVARFVNIVKEMQQSQPDLPMIGAGTAWLRHLVPKVAAGLVKNGWATLFGQGRNSFAYPESPYDILNHGAMNLKQVCMACSGCTDLMRAESPTGCILRDRDYYKIPS
ncbi:MAG: NADH:flavin oxidoreductase [Planctomycetaceae bacterium]|jgi:2,4-dienoyl-CoA reductase-like NADH-dependent reductase (Old Yellow Enzyme family)|nr:NADH:flavin oxidoreductase [Planctomycetaceae bacterium]